MTKFVIKTSCAKMPNKVKSPYRHVAVLEIRDDAPPPSMISTHARGVVRIVRKWENCNVGKNIKSAYTRALSEARELVLQLEAGA